MMDQMLFFTKTAAALIFPVAPFTFDASIKAQMEVYP